MTSFKNQPTTVWIAFPSHLKDNDNIIKIFFSICLGALTIVVSRKITINRKLGKITLIVILITSLIIIISIFYFYNILIESMEFLSWISGLIV